MLIHIYVFFIAVLDKNKSHNIDKLIVTWQQQFNFKTGKII